jgi:hypothetical protein
MGQVDMGTSPTKSSREASTPLGSHSGPAESATLLTYVRSREGALGLLSMALLIFQGTALSLTLRYSRLASIPAHPPLAMPPPLSVVQSACPS